MFYSDLTCAPSSEMHSAPKTNVHILATMGPIFLGTSTEDLYGVKNPGIGPFSRNLLEGRACKCTSGSLPHLLEASPLSLGLSVIQAKVLHPLPGPLGHSPAPGGTTGWAARSGGGMCMLRALMLCPRCVT